MSNPPPTLIAANVRYYHKGDERTFFEWLARIPCVQSFVGVRGDLLLHLRSMPDDEDLRELLAFFYRYKIDMRQLAQFANTRNSIWFKKAQSDWYQHVFSVPPVISDTTK